MSYPTKLGAYLAANHTGNGAWAHQDESGIIHLRDWPDSNPPSPEQVEAWSPSPLPGIKAAQKSREQLAREALLDCKGKAFLALVAGGMSQEAANEAGTDLVVQHASLISAYEVAGGNAKAKAALIAAIEADPPAWWGPQYLAIFEDAL